MDIACPACGDKMELRKAKLMGLDVSTWICTHCGEEVYDFSGIGLSCRNCSGAANCLGR